MNDKNDGIDDMDDEMLTQLISLADEGPTIPREGLEKTRSAARSVWIETIRQHRRRRGILMVAALAAVVVTALVIGTLVNRPTPALIPTVAQVDAVSGDAWLETESGNQIRMTAGAEVPAGSTLVAGTEGRLALRLTSGHSVRVDRQTKATIRPGNLIELSNGGVYVESGVIHSAGIRIVTPLGDATDIGTRFEVRYEKDQLKVLVRSGTVRVNLPEKALRVETGTGLLISRSADPVRIPVTSWGSEWNWTRTIAPPFEIEGRTVDAFLKWYERETGRRVNFSDANTERLAKETTLHGTTVEIAPERAAEGVLMSAGLEGEMKNGEITIRSIKPGKDLVESY